MIIEPSRFASRLLNKPIALHPSYFPSAMTIEASDFYEVSSFCNGYEVSSGIAVIPVMGVLFQSLGYPFSLGFATGYDFIRLAVTKAMLDPEVKAVVLSISSGGGECAGCFDLADAIYAMRGEKPIWAVLSESAYSAAYAIASACDKIYVPRTGGTGSIGIIAAHCDVSQALTKAGIKVTFITYGERKADGHSEIPLSEEALSAYQTEIDSLGELFVETVARNRNIAAATVRDTQAACFMGAKGVALGLADEVAAPDAAFRALVKQITV